MYFIHTCALYADRYACLSAYVYIVYAYLYEYAWYIYVYTSTSLCMFIYMSMHGVFMYLQVHQPSRAWVNVYRYIYMYD